jgi:hypothetical protein
MVRGARVLEGPHTVAQLYELPREILGVFNTILYKNKFQNPQILHQPVRFLTLHR